MKDALRIVESWFKPYAHAQISQGNVTVANHFYEFDARYRFFRAKADEAFKQANTLVPEAIGRRQGFDSLRDLTDIFNQEVKAKHEGFYYSTAMVDAYFSRLEHRLVLLLAFRGQPLAKDALKQFLRAKWDDKLTQIIDIKRDHAAQLVLGRLRRIKERIRNPFAHGGIENDGGSLFFHMTGVGALPANFSRIKNSARFNLIPVEHDDHQSACALLDELDALLETDDLTLPHRLVEDGVDPAFDAETLARYREAIRSPEAVEAFTERWARECARHANAEY